MFIDERLEKAFKEHKLKDEFVALLDECKEKEDIKKVDYAWQLFARKYDFEEDAIKRTYFRFDQSRNVSTKGFFDFMGWSKDFERIKQGLKRDGYEN